MALPDLTNFNEFLRHLTTSKPKNSSEYQSQEVFYPPQKNGLFDQTSIAIDQYGQKYSIPEYIIWYKNIGKFNLKTLISRIISELKIKSHVCGEKIVLNLLCLFSIFPNRDKNPVAMFNTILNSITYADLTQIYVLPFPPPENYNFKFGSFSVGPIDLQKLAYRCKKADSDFYERYSKKLRGNLAFQRKVISVKLVNWPFFINKYKIHFKNNPGISAQFNDTLTTYFHIVSLDLFEDFWNTVLEEQHMTIAMGASYIDPLTIQKYLSCSLISIFLNIGEYQKGFVASDTAGILSLDLVGTNKNIPEAEKRLKRDFNLEDFKDSEIHQTIKTFSRFIVIFKIISQCFIKNKIP